MSGSDPTTVALVEALASAHRTVESLTAQNEALQADVRQLTRLVEGLQRQVAELLARQPAPSSAAPDASSNAGAGTPEPRNDRPSSITPPKRRKETKRPKRKPRRGPPPAHLERDTEEIPVRDCPSCGSTNLAELPPEVSEKLDYVRAHVRVRRTVRQSVRCRGCRTLTTAPLPPTALPGGSMTASFLSHVAYQKCGLHLPLARIAEDLRHQGVTMASSTLCDVMKHVARLVEPIVDRIVKRLFASGLLHTDGTGLKVLEPGKKGKHRGQIAVFCNEELTAFHFSPSKHGKHFEKFLRVGTKRAYRGWLVADAASNMDLLYRDGHIVECGCWYHLRDKFEEAQPGAPTRAEEALAWIGAVFDVETEADEADDTAEVRLTRRRRESRVLVERFEQWMVEARKEFLPDEELYKATQYYRNHRTALLRFLDDGRIPLSNNLAERELGVIGRGRKNYLFAGSDEGGRRLGQVYTVVRTCQRLGIDPFAYLADVLPRLSVMRANREPGLLDTLVPWTWKAARSSA